MLDFKKLGFTPELLLDDGHGKETAGKRTPAFSDGTVIRENTFNKAVINLLEADAKRLGFKTVQVAPEDTDTPLQTRTDRANAAWAEHNAQYGDQRMINGKTTGIFISEHFNAMMDTWEGSTAEGVETFCFALGGEGEKIARAVHKYLLQGTPQVNRGVKTANFHVLRETDMPAILVEAGFMDDPEEAALMISQAFQKETAKQILQGICEYYGLEYQEEEPPFVGTPLIGPATATVEQAQEWARKNGAPQEFIDQAPLYWEIWADRGLNPAIGYVQFAHETGWLYKIKSAAGIDATYHNPCGLKTTQGGGDYTASAHTKFPDWRTGIIAHADHAALYAGAPGYPKAGSPDPRHFDFIKGTAKYLEQLGGKWAPSATYGTNLAVKLKVLEATEAPKVDSLETRIAKKLLENEWTTDLDYWTQVLEGKIPANPEYLKILFGRATGVK